GGVESISCVQKQASLPMLTGTWLQQHRPAVYWPMLQTAETVARRYGIDRERQDRCGARSQQRAAAAAEAGRFVDESVPITVTAARADRTSGRLYTEQVTLDRDDGIRDDTTFEGVSKIRSAVPGGSIAAGNASQY